MGVDVSQAYNDIENAVETMRARALVAYGLMDKQEATWIQRLQAEGVEYNMMTLVMAKCNMLEQAKMGKSIDNASEALQRHKAEWKEARVAMGEEHLSPLLASR